MRRKQGYKVIGNKPQMSWNKSFEKPLKFEAKLPEFKVKNGAKYVNYGNDNLLNVFLLELYQKSAKHNAIINGKVNYIVGKGWTYDAKAVTGEALATLQTILENPNPYDDLNDILFKVANDLEIFNSIALEVVWNFQGEPSAISHVNAGKIRVSPDFSKFYFAEEWKKSGDPDGLIEYEPFNPDNRFGKQLFYFGSYSPATIYYPLPEYFGAISYIETDARIANFHVNNLRNGFLGGMIFNFNNGLPSEEEEIEIEKEVKNKFAGDSGDRIMIAFNDGRDRALEVLPINPADIDKQFDILNSQIQQEIFTSHRVTSGMLFGIKESGQLGGRSEIIEAYELFKNVYINDRQQKIEKIFNYILSFAGLGNVLSIVPTDPINERLTEASLMQIASRAELRTMAGLPDDSVNTPKTTDSIQALSPLVANKILEKMTDAEIRSLAGLPPSTASSTPIQFSSISEDKEVLALFAERGHIQEEFIELKSRPMRYGFENQEIEFASEYEDLDSQILKEIEKNPNVSATEISIATGQDIDLISERISYLIDQGAINIKGTLKELGEKSKDFIRKEKGIAGIEIMYKYDVLPEYGKAIIPTTREFCKVMIESKKYFRRQDIDFISQRVGRSVWETRGGWYHDPTNGVTRPSCRHIWSQVLVKRKKS